MLWFAGSTADVPVLGSALASAAWALILSPLALLLVTLGLARYGVRWWTVALVGASIVINAWGVYWGIVLGW